MQVAKTRIPHFTYVEEVDVTEVERLRGELNRAHGDSECSSSTVLPFLMRAVVVARRDFPQMNARYDDEEGVVHRHHSVHLGIATQTVEGSDGSRRHARRGQRSVGLCRRSRPDCRRRHATTRSRSPS